MEKNSSDKNSGSDREENNDNGEISSTSPFNSNNFCNSCCSCDNNVGTDCERRILNPVIAEDIPAPGRARSQKLDVLKCMSLARTNREQEAIHNVLQFIEALTYSNSFVRRYNMPGYFCHQCSIGENCDCYVEDQCHLSQVGCSCGRCSDDSSTSGSSTCSLCDNTDECPSADHTGRARTQSLRNRRRRERRRNSRLNSRNSAENPKRNENMKHRECDSKSACAQPRQSNFIPRVPQRNLYENSTSREGQRNNTFHCSVNDCDADSSVECSYPLLANRSSPICNIPNCRDYYRSFHDAQTSSPLDPSIRIRGAQESTTTSSDECICELYGKSGEDISCHCWRPQAPPPRITITAATTSSDTEEQRNNAVHSSVNDCDADSSVECSYPLLANHSTSIGNIPNRDDCYSMFHGAQTPFVCYIPNCNIGTAQESTTTSSDECICELYGKSGEDVPCHCWRPQGPRPRITITAATTSSDTEGQRNNVVHGSVNECDTDSSVECSYPLLDNHSPSTGNIPNRHACYGMCPGVQPSSTSCIPDCKARIVAGSTSSDNQCICGVNRCCGEDIPCRCWGPLETSRRGRGDGKSSSKSSSEETRDCILTSSEECCSSNCHCAQCRYPTRINVSENSEESSEDCAKDQKGDDPESKKNLI
ncbi:hypothetical protein JTE90_010386 [Oedothorax gibbosus]|uniref:Uncharacterized protein n=1 Tax=Oedothorax gibbosus TaxID=931172 RepID=A0AAV6W011_9ARAC|nr:hypothetical protein JTE90_010386 [Oedothorax gibbosus]